MTNLFQQGLRIVLVVICYALFAHASNPHKVHVSVAQLDFDATKQKVGVVLRVYGDDLEAALSRHAKREIKINLEAAKKDPQLGDTVLGYLRDTFVLKDKAGRPIKLAWSGLESQMDMIWLHLEGRLPGGLAGTQLRNKLFCELFEDQVNIVNAKHQGKQLGLMFEAKDEFKMLTDRPPNK